MAGWRFPGGLRLAPDKIPGPRPIQVPSLPDRLFIPLLQHQGLPAKACVEPGQTVARGERIGRADGLLSAHVHASASGRVVAIAERDIGHANGRPVPCVELAPDGLDTEQRLALWPDWRQRGADAVLARLRDAGITGLGGATFPTDVKLAGSIRTLIVNGVECEPHIAADDALLCHRADEPVAGAAMLAHVLGASRCLLAIGEGMDRALAAARLAAVKLHVPVEIVAVPARYPQGGERQLVRTLTGIQLDADRPPLEHGIACLNVATAAAAWRAVTLGEALTRRIVSVTGPGVRMPGSFDVPLGTPVAHLVAAAGGYTPSARRLVLGGAMMGQALAHDEVPIGKNGNCVLVLDREQTQPGAPELPCIRCGECQRVCPSRLSPQQLHFHIQADAWDKVAGLAMADCIECGLCAYVCPSQIPLLASFRYGKTELARQARERERAALSRQRHQARQRRLEELAAARAERLRARENAPDAVALALAKASARRAEQGPHEGAGRPGAAPGSRR